MKIGVKFISLSLIGSFLVVLSIKTFELFYKINICEWQVDQCLHVSN